MHTAIVTSGKHPAWADYMPTQGTPSKFTNRTLKQLFNLSELAIADVQARPKNQIVDFDAFFYSKMDSEFCFGLIRDSKDKVGRRFPLILSAYDTSINPKACMNKYLPSLRDLAKDCVSLKTPEDIKRAVNSVNDLILAEQQAMMSGRTIDLSSISSESIKDIHLYLDGSEDDPLFEISQLIKEDKHSLYFIKLINRVHNYLLIKSTLSKDDLATLYPIRVKISEASPEDSVRLWSILLSKILPNHEFFIISNNKELWADIIFDSISNKEVRYILHKRLPDYVIEHSLSEEDTMEVLKRMEKAESCEDIMGSQSSFIKKTSSTITSVKEDVSFNPKEKTFLILGILLFIVVLVAVVALIVIALRMAPAEESYLLPYRTITAALLTP